VLARAVKVLFYDVWFSWDDMVGAVDNMMGKHDDEYREIKEDLPFSLLLAPRNYRDHPSTWKSWGFDIVLTHSHFQCVDPRDKVYALLGLIDMDRRSINIDYEKSANQVYADLVFEIYSLCLERGQTEDELHYCTSSIGWCLRDFKRLYIQMHGQEFHKRTLKRFLSSIFDTEHAIEFLDPHLPAITAIGFDNASENISKDRWWFKYQGKRYYVECDSSKWTMDTGASSDILARLEGNKRKWEEGLPRTRQQ
jgi:hypothetical protein